jgi:hypothetical protein
VVVVSEQDEPWELKAHNCMCGDRDRWSQGNPVKSGWLRQDSVWRLVVWLGFTDSLLEHCMWSVGSRQQTKVVLLLCVCGRHHA